MDGPHARSKSGVQKKEAAWVITPKKQPNGEAEEERGMYLADRIGSRHHICLETYRVNKKTSRSELIPQGGNESQQNIRFKVSPD